MYIKIFSTHYSPVDFCGGRKTGETGEKPLKHRREPTTNSTHISPELENRTRTTAVRGNALKQHTPPMLPYTRYTCMYLKSANCFPIQPCIGANNRSVKTPARHHTPSSNQDKMDAIRRSNGASHI
jgi:hypothetical protein